MYVLGLIYILLEIVRLNIIFYILIPAKIRFVPRQRKMVALERMITLMLAHEPELLTNEQIKSGIREKYNIVLRQSDTNLSSDPIFKLLKKMAPIIKYRPRSDHVYVNKRLLNLKFESRLSEEWVWMDNIQGYDIEIDQDDFYQNQVAVDEIADTKKDPYLYVHKDLKCLINDEACQYNRQLLKEIIAGRSFVHFYS